jgi:hypothetical protein
VRQWRLYPLIFYKISNLPLILNFKKSKVKKKNQKKDVLVFLGIDIISQQLNMIEGSQLKIQGSN